ncbi:MAG: type II secretion system F family protein [Planctomycetota bacterium]
MSRAALSNPKSFLYLAAKQGGGRSVGLKAAISERALADQLRRDRLVLLQTWALPSWVSAEQEMKLKDQAALNDQLAQLLERGVPLVEALEVSESVVSAAQRERVRRMRELVAGGKNFAETAQVAGGFDSVTVAVYRASEQTGDLAGAARQLAKTARRRLAVSGKATTLLIYPAIVGTIGFLASMILIVFVLPQIADSIEGAGAELPVYTKILVGIGDGLRINWLPVLIGVSFLLTTAILARKTVLRGLGVVARSIPGFGEVLLTQELARFFAVLGAMSRAGVPLADGLAVAARAIGYPKLRRQLDRMRARLVQGGVLSSLIDEVDTLPLSTRKLLIAADRAGDLDQAFDTLAEDMGERLDVQTSRLLAALEPILIVLLFLVIGSLILAIMIPILSIAGQGAG